MIRYLDLADFLLIAEAVLEIEAEALYRQVNLPMAESALAAPRAGFGEVEFYPEFAQKVAVLGHPAGQEPPVAGRQQAHGAAVHDRVRGAQRPELASPRRR